MMEPLASGPSGPSREAGALFTDLYELTMAQAYRVCGMSGLAVFETFFRKLPSTRSYVVAAGLDDVLDYLSSFRFEPDDIEYLRSLGLFRGEFLESLAKLRFTGDVWAVPEGTVVFPHEPIIQVSAPIEEAQLVETFILNQVHVQSVLASKAARVVQAARGRPVVDFGSRRSHGVDAAFKLAKTSYLVGAAGTSNLAAARRYGIPAYGTMAHSFVQAFDSEASAFEAFVRLYPDTTVLVDTYDSMGGVARVIELSRQLGSDFYVRAIRLDSGDLGDLSKRTRAELDAAGLRHVEIFASSNLDETRIAALLDAKCPIDGFGVGTRWGVSRDAPALDMAYKLVEYDGRGRTKLSTDKVIYPGRKQVFRREKDGYFLGDTIALAHERLPGEPLLIQVMKQGRRVDAFDASLPGARRRFQSQCASLPSHLLALGGSPVPYPVDVSPTLQADLQRLRSSGGGHGQSIGVSPSSVRE